MVQITWNKLAQSAQDHNVDIDGAGEHSDAVVDTLLSTPRMPDTWAVKCNCDIIFSSSERRSAVVLNHSSTGAQIRFQTQSALPDQIFLIVPSLNLHRRAIVAWQQGFDVGLRFFDVERAPIWH